jgi:hypothetical protein
VVTIDAFALVRATLASHPVAALIAVMLALAALRAAAPGALAAFANRRVLTVAALGALAAFAAIAGWYATQLAYFDQAEPTIPAVAAVFAAGKPLYPALDAPERYAHVYGPVLFIVQASALTLIGPSIAVSKAVGVAAIFFSLLGTAWVVAARRGVVAGVWSSAACAVVYLAFGDVTFWTRGDPLLILLVVAGIAAADRRDGWAAIYVLAVVLGLSFNVKLTGPVYLVPVVALGLRDRGWRDWVALVAMAAFIAAAPFALPNVSAVHYLDYLVLSAGNGLSAATLRHNAEWALFLCAPLAAVWQAPNRDRTVREAALWMIPAVVLIGVAGAKLGGGPFHLLPFVPAIAFLFAASIDGSEWRHWYGRVITPAVLSVSLLLAAAQQWLFVQTVRARDLHQASAEIRMFVQSHPGSAPAIGYAGTSYLSLIRPEVVFKSGTYLLDAPAVQEHQLAGLAVPASTIRAIATCVVPIWLIPATGDPPFLVPSAYTPQGPPTVFSSEFQDAFRRHYERTSSTGLFDVWTCRGLATSIPKVQLPTSKGSRPRA